MDLPASTHRLSHHRALSWAPCATQRFPTPNYLFHTVCVRDLTPPNSFPSYYSCCLVYILHSPFCMSNGFIPHTYVNIWYLLLEFTSLYENKIPHHLCILLVFNVWAVFSYVYHIFIFICWGTFKLLPHHRCVNNTAKHLGACDFELWFSIRCAQWWDLLGVSYSWSYFQILAGVSITVL